MAPSLAVSSFAPTAPAALGARARAARAARGLPALRPTRRAATQVVAASMGVVHIASDPVAGELMQRLDRPDIAGVMTHAVEPSSHSMLVALNAVPLVLLLGLSFLGFMIFFEYETFRKMGA